MPDIYIISTGTGHPDMLTGKAKKALSLIDLAVGGERFRGWVSVPYHVPEPLISGTHEFIRNNRGKRIGVLVTGDAGFFSLAKSVVKEFGRENVTVIEGISVVQAAFAAIAEPWENAVFLSAHGRNGFDAEKAVNAERFLILCDKVNNPRKIIEENSRLIKNFELWVTANLSLDSERIHRVTLNEPIPEDALSCVVGIRKTGE
ncbi:precorrin-6y C5,15-methyltransferase (decarboxylating) subunit CbiE [Geovibrio thiophilus]|uniref:Precorrin-6y C5,15-methyltransferase (Decarboxylating) subunit CbiE n=1 Tax=Geovibrio thiophilus TaxID=139438 RepID=A0A410JZ82_9BACT|nr:precorrin-6y C5,15-methyltransferase (decarboxylating) subunit CbiE [Geovibrio thiophilus]QAR33439.1 precorrin-6y C5,15-methyltransferase (decarboxylating) subunit CbiE [Geovibrio thiophilus]